MKYWNNFVWLLILVKWFRAKQSSARVWRTSNLFFLSVFLHVWAHAKCLIK